MEFLTSKSSLAEERRIWLSRNIKLATRIQNVQARDTIFKCITCDRQTIRRSLHPFNLVACLFITSEAGRRPTAAFFFLETLAVTFCLCVHETTKSIEFLQTRYHDVLLWLLCFFMINIQVIVLTIGIYWLLLIECNVVLFCFVMLLTTVQLINMKLEPMSIMCLCLFQQFFAE